MQSGFTVKRMWLHQIQYIQPNNNTWSLKGTVAQQPVEGSDGGWKMLINTKL